jgi:serine protease Do
MKRSPTQLFILSLALAAAVAWAPPAQASCGREAQACLDHLAARFAERGWAGIELEPSEEYDGMAVTRVYEGTPAAKAGIQIGDTVVAIDGVRLEDAETLHHAQDAMPPGKTVGMTVSRRGVEREVRVTLIAVPDAVLARMIGQHMIEYHVRQASN